MKRTEQVYLEQDREPILVFHPREFARYQREAEVFILPSDSRTLLQCACHLTQFVDSLYQQEEEQHDEDFALGRLPTKLMSWYQDVRARQQSTENRLYRINRLYFWVAYARVFGLVVRERADLHRLYTASSTSQFAYCSIVAERFNVVVSNAAIGSLSINELRNSARLICPTLYTYPYSAAMKQYVHALFYRYVSLMTYDQTEEAVDTVFDNPLFYSTSRPADSRATNTEDETLPGLVEAFEEMSLAGTGEGYAINNKFVFDGEKLFAPQLYRLHLSARLVRAASLTLSNVTNRQQLALRALGAWRDFVVSVGENKRLRSETINNFKKRLIDIHMYHGERERYREHFPYASDDNRQILMEMRPAVLRELTLTQEMSLRAIVAAYTEQMQAALEHDDAALSATHSNAFAAPLYELECLLISRVTLTAWYACEGVERYAELRDALLFEELESLERLDELVTHAMTPPVKTRQQQQHPKGTNRGRRAELRAKRQQQMIPMPLCMKLMRRYYVIEREHGHVFETQLFFEALFVWQVLCLRASILTREVLHSKTLRILDEFETLL